MEVLHIVPQSDTGPSPRFFEDGITLQRYRRKGLSSLAEELQEALDFVLQHGIHRSPLPWDGASVNQRAPAERLAGTILSPFIDPRRARGLLHDALDLFAASL